jgi:hypothetical protein
MPKHWEINPNVPHELHDRQFSQEARRPQGDVVEIVESEYGEHERTRPGEGYTPPGEGRPQGRTVDNAPIDYRVRQAQDTYGDGVFAPEDLYAPPPPEPPKPGQTPMLPQEFEAIWHKRALERQAREAKGSVINTEAFMRGDQKVGYDVRIDSHTPPLGPAQPAMSQLALHERELDRKNSKDQVIAQLEAQIKQRQEELAREKAANEDLELRIVRTNGQTVFLLVKNGQTSVVTRSYANNVLDGLLS